MSYQLDTIFAKADKAEPETTGSVPKTAELPPEADLVFARRAAYEVLSRGSKDVSVPWENPQNGARGTVTPLGADYHAGGLICRDFLASHVTSEKEAWMQGEACRASSSRTAKWEIRALKPWRRT
jgi:surface antigen